MASSRKKLQSENTKPIGYHQECTGLLQVVGDCSRCVFRIVKGNLLDIHHIDNFLTLVLFDERPEQHWCLHAEDPAVDSDHKCNNIQVLTSLKVVKQVSTGRHLLRHVRFGNPSSKFQAALP